MVERLVKVVDPVSHHPLPDEIPPPLDQGKVFSFAFGDIQLSDGRRVLLFSSDAHLKILARAGQILQDATFRITPSLWTQTFIINASVTSSTFIPTVIALLPDKKRDTYDAMFGSLKENLEARGLELSARYMMSDFELAIRDSFISHFPDVEAKGCAFHFCQAIMKKIAKNGFKGQYSDPKCAAFRGFIRGMMGIVNVPPLRLKEAIRNLYIMADKLTGRQRSFSISLI